MLLYEHDRLYGPGTGRDFFEGAYANDLERAVLVRIRPELDRRRDQAVRDDAARRQEEQRQDLARQAEQARLDKARAERKEQAEGARNLVRDETYNCTNARLLNLVRSGEPASMLARAAMTLCSREVDSLVDASIGIYRIERGGTLLPAEESAFRERGRETIYESVLAAAVQAKGAYLGNK